MEMLSMTDQDHAETKWVSFIFSVLLLKGEHFSHRSKTILIVLPLWIEYMNQPWVWYKMRFLLHIHPKWYSQRIGLIKGLYHCVE